MPLVLTLTLTDLATNSILGTYTSAGRVHVVWEINQVDTLDVLVHGAAASMAIQAARASGNVELLVAVNGVPLARKLLEAPKQDIALPGPCTESGPSTAVGYDTTPIDHITAYNTTVGAVLDQLFAIPPGIPGVFAPAELGYTYTLPQGVAQLAVSEDLDAISVLKAVQILARRLGAQLTPEHGNWYADSANKTINIGQVGTAIMATFGAGGLPYAHHTTRQMDWQGTFSQLRRVIGGASTHGLPQGSRITGCLWLASIAGILDAHFVVSVYAGSTLGGVYYLTPDLVFHPLSQNMGVTALWYDTPRNRLYAATDRGVYEALALLGPSIWKETGGDPTHKTFSGKVTDLFVDGVQVYALAAGNDTGLNGLLTYPATPADLGAPGGLVFGLGHDYWSMLSSQAVIAASAINDIVYVCYANDPTYVVRVEGMFGAGAKSTLRLQTPSKYAVTKMVRTAAGTWVLTAGGSQGLHFIAGNAANLGGFVPRGLPSTMVNNIVQTADGHTYACTDQGIWLAGARRWTPVSTIGFMGNTSLNYLAVAGAKSTITHLDGSTAKITQMLAAGQNGLYDSNSNGLLWRDLLAQRVDVAASLRNQSVPVPAGMAWLQYADADGNQAQGLVKTTGPFAPFAGATFVEEPTLAADQNFSHEIASAATQDVAQRYLLSVERGVSRVETDSYFTDSSTPHLTLRPTMRALIAYHEDACRGWPAIDGTEVLQVVRHEVTIDEQGGRSHTVLADTQVTTRYNPDEFAQDQLAKLARAAK